ncbi:hypothetical protein CFC21_099597 [Triticum aestivum]|uniref:Uncharacterized protein n=2 Tax=Triticum aestivum TaxID=4565 RepID=A0A3B6RKZ7_WHEAT|nr:hypothetical protein CFC21_099597 [Triticum aestivum]
MSLALLCSVVLLFPCVSPWPPHLRNSSSIDPPFSSALDEDRPRHGSMEQRLLVLEFLFDSWSSHSGPPIPYCSCSSLPVLQVRSGCWFRQKRKMDVGMALDVITGAETIVSRSKIFQAISCSTQKDRNLARWNLMQQVSEKCKLFPGKKNMTKVPDVQTQAVSEHVFYIGSIFVKFPSAIEPEEEAIKPTFRTPPCSWFFVGKNSAPSSCVTTTSSSRREVLSKGTDR